MHIKTFVATDWTEITEPPKLVKVSSRGLLGSDRAALVKQAGDQFAHLVSNLELLPGQEPVHLTAMGAYEFFGNNRNGDGFEARELEKHAQTFVTNGRHYRNHANKNPARSYGRPKLAFYNPRMRRVELLDVLNGTKEAADRDGGLVADKELDILTSGKELPVSMACSIDHDICQACGNKAPTRKQYCKSAAEGGTCTRFGCSTGLTKVGEDGFVQGLYNPRPQFFDISSVDLGADKIAFGHLADYLMRKQAADATLSLSLDAKLARTLLDLRPLVRVAYKLAAMEDDWRPRQLHNNLARSFHIAEQVPLDTTAYSPRSGEKSASYLRELAAAGVLVSLAEFSQLTGTATNKAAVDAAACALPGIFTRLVHSEGLDDLLRAQPLGVASLLFHSHTKAASAAAARSLSDDYVQLRCATSAIKSPDWTPTWRTSGYDAAPDAARQLAREYAAYKVAFLHHYCDQTPLTAELILLQNYICR